jgi:hypothetical protein
MRPSKLVVGFLVAGLCGCGFKSAGTVGAVTGAGGASSGGSDGSGGSGSGGNGSGGHVGSGGESGSGSGGWDASGGNGFFGSGGGGGDVGFVDASPNCGQTSVTVTPVPPDILIVQDRSLSMTDNTMDKACDGGIGGPGMPGNGNGHCGATSKWALVTAALNQVVQQTETKVNWGLMFLGAEPTQCGAATAPVVDVGPSNFSAIQAALTGETFSGLLGTPTGPVMNNAVKYLTGLTDPNPKYLLLATDGEPNCAGGSNTLNVTDDVGAENAVTAAYTAGFPTFVVGIATTTDATASNALNAMAVNGGEAQTGAATQYYAVSDTATLVSVLGQILGKALSCTIPLTGVNGSLDKVAVSAKDANGNTIEIMQDPTNGWSYTDANKTAIILNGDSCTNLQSVTYTDFQFIYTCATGMIKIG